MWEHPFLQELIYVYTFCSKIRKQFHYFSDLKISVSYFSTWVHLGCRRWHLRAVEFGVCWGGGDFMLQCAPVKKSINGVSTSHFFPPAQNPPKPIVSETVRWPRSFPLIFQQRFVEVAIMAEESLKRTTAILTAKQIWKENFLLRSPSRTKSRLMSITRHERPQTYLKYKSHLTF